MEAFNLEIAGLVSHVQPLFGSTREYFRRYLTDKPSELLVQVTAEDLAFEQAMFEQEAIEEGMKIRKFTDPFLERATIQRKVAEKLLERDTVLLHGSTVGLDGSAYLFTAPCGTGKSTHTRLWREVFADRALMVNDDKTFLRLTGDGVLAFGSPWSGKHGLDTNVCLPLKGICFLQRGKENAIRRAVPEECLPELRHQCMIPEDDQLAKTALDLIDRLAQIVPLWSLECNKEPEAARISWEAMSTTQI